MGKRNYLIEGVSGTGKTSVSKWGGKQSEREHAARLHQTKEDIPKSGIIIDTTEPIANVVDEIVRQSATQ